MIGLAKVEGFAELDRALTRLGGALSEAIVEQALIEAAEPMRAAMAALARRGAGAGPHLADHMLAARTDEHELTSREVVVEVGPELRPADFFYGYFLEYGTAKHHAFPFARPAFDETVNRVLARFVDAVWVALARQGITR